MATTLPAALHKAAAALRPHPQRKAATALLRRLSDHQLSLDPEVEQELTGVIVGLLREIDVTRNEARMNLRVTSRAVSEAMRRGFR